MIYELKFKTGKIVVTSDVIRGILSNACVVFGKWQLEFISKDDAEHEVGHTVFSPHHFAARTYFVL
jgi:hypothetical protein